MSSVFIVACHPAPLGHTYRLPLPKKLFVPLPSAFFRGSFVPLHTSPYLGDISPYLPLGDCDLPSACTCALPSVGTNKANLAQLPFPRWSVLARPLGKGTGVRLVPLGGFESELNRILVSSTISAANWHLPKQGVSNPIRPSKKTRIFYSIFIAKDMGLTDCQRQPGVFDLNSKPAGNAVNQTIICLSILPVRASRLWASGPQISLEPETWNPRPETWNFSPGGVELESNCSRPAVTLHFLRPISPMGQIVNLPYATTDGRCCSRNAEDETRNLEPGTLAPGGVELESNSARTPVNLRFLKINPSVPNPSIPIPLIPDHLRASEPQANVAHFGDTGRRSIPNHLIPNHLIPPTYLICKRITFVVKSLHQLGEIYWYLPVILVFRRAIQRREL